MNIFISLLRGINVSGHKKINMKELTAIYESLGLKHVYTYIQSGNVVFTHDTYSEKELEVILYEAIETHYSFQVPIIVLSAKKLTLALESMPFSDITPDEQGSQIMFSFLDQKANMTDTPILIKHLSQSEKLHVLNDIIYLHCPNGYGKTKVTNNLIENKLKLTATTRNLKTIIKLCEMTHNIN